MDHPTHLAFAAVERAPNFNLDAPFVHDGLLERTEPTGEPRHRRWHYPATGGACKKSGEAYTKPHPEASRHVGEVGEHPALEFFCSPTVFERRSGRPDGDGNEMPFRHSCTSV